MPKYSDDYRVRVGDADSRGMLKLPSLLGMLQEAAKDHAEALGIGASALLPMDLGWALSKLHLNIERLPSCGERVFVKTWPSVRTRISTEREFVLSDEMGDRVATARTLWVLFDVKKGGSKGWTGSASGPARRISPTRSGFQKCRPRLLKTPCRSPISG